MKKILFFFTCLVLATSFNIAQTGISGKKESRKAYNNAVQMIRAGNYSMAIKHLETCLEIDSLYTDAWSLLAKSKVEVNDISGAVEDFYTLATLAPSNGEPWPGDCSP